MLCYLISFNFTGLVKEIFFNLRCKYGDDNNDDSWTFEDFQEKIMSDKKGKGTLKGNTFLQLKEGVCFIDDIHRYAIS
ncbi:calmodulin-binding protein 60, partial [Tanacetum coccineum]